MKRLIVFVVLFGAFFAWLALDSGSMKDTTDFVLVGIAAFLLAGVAFFLGVAAIAIFRAFANWKTVAIREEGYFHVGPLKSYLIPWDHIDSVEIKMITPTRIYRYGTIHRSKIKVPKFNIHWIDKDEDLVVTEKDMLAAIGRIQDLLRAKSPLYKQRDIDWVERWRAVDPEIEYQAEMARIKAKAAEPIPADIQQRLDELKASGMPEKKVFKEYLRLMEEREMEEDEKEEQEKQ